ISVVVEPHEAGLRHRGRQRVESVEAPAIADEPRPLLLEHLPDRLPALLGMGVSLGPDDTFVDEPAIQLPVALDLEPRREEALAHEADLVLDLTLLTSPPPACRRPARRGGASTSGGSGDCTGGPCRRRPSPPPSSCCRRCRAGRRPG